MFQVRIKNAGIWSIHIGPRGDYNSCISNAVGESALLNRFTQFHVLLACIPPMKRGFIVLLKSL